jgi:hypothetical protein
MLGSAHASTPYGMWTIKSKTQAFATNNTASSSSSSSSPPPPHPSSSSSSKQGLGKTACSDFIS